LEGGKSEFPTKGVRHPRASTGQHSLEFQLKAARTKVGVRWGVFDNSEHRGVGGERNGNK